MNFKKIAVLMILATVGLSSYSQQGTKIKASDEVLVYSGFRDNGQDGIYLAWSEDGFHFKALNNNQPVMQPPVWKDQNLTRDPSMIYHDGLFRAVWTTQWWGNCFGYAESKDLIHWSEPMKVEPFSHITDPKDKPKIIYAPEITWDPLQKNYLIVFTSRSEREEQNKERGITFDKGNLGECLYCTRTSDFKNFAPAREFFKQNYSSIDGHLTFLPDGNKDPKKGRWAMVFKDEREVVGKNIHIAYNNADFSEGWTPLSEPISGPNSSIRPNEQVEGPCLVRWQDKWFLYYDAFADGHYAGAVSTDLKNWTDIAGQIVTPEHPRHGTIFKAPRAIVEKLK